MSIKIPIVSDFDGRGVKLAVAQFKSLEKTSERAQFAIRKAAVPATAALAGLGTFAFKAAQKASDLNEEIQKSEVIFGAASKDIVSFSKTAATAIGQSQRSALEAAGTFGVLGKAAGLTEQDLTKFSKQFTTLSSDLASFNNTSPEDAIQAIGAALRGEAEPIRRYGVLLNDATLRQKALELGLIATTKEALTPQNKTLAAQAVILEQTKDAQGDFARTSGGLANQQRILKARVEDATASFGRAFLPILEQIIPILSSMAGFVEKNSGLVGALTIALGLFAGTIVAARIALAAWKTVSLITTGINYALATSFTAVQVSTGIGIATALAGAGAFVIINNKMKAARKAAEGFAGSLTGVSGETGRLKNLIDQSTKANVTNTDATDTATAATEKLAKAKSKAAAAAKKLKDALKEAKTALRDDFAKALDVAQDKLKQAQDAFTGFASKVSDALSSSLNFKDAYEAGSDTGGGFIAGLQEQTEKIKNFGVLVNRLIAAGLSEAALTKVLDAGVDAGSAIAEELLSGADNILKANELVAEVQGIADLVGKNSAMKFYDAGVVAGQNLVAGVQASIDAFELKLKTPGLTAGDVNMMRSDFNAGGSGAGFDFSNIDFSNLFLDLNLGDLMGNVPFLSQGGLVSSPTLSVIGESGPEAVIPLDRLGEFGGGMNITVNAGLVSTPDQIGQEIIQAIQKAQRRSGPVFAPA
jgi:hypothetical protein